MSKVNYEVIHSDSGEGIHAKAWVHGVDLEVEARDQIKNLLGLPFVTPHVAVMPDAHAGKGSTVGTVIVTHKAIIPATVGVDLGCGVIACKTNIKASEMPDNLLQLRHVIESKIPHGRTNNGGVGDRGAWYNVPHDIILQAVGGQFDRLMMESNLITGVYGKLSKPIDRCINQLGTLGTGNHFVEVCLDTEDSVWIMIHSGSRGVGNAIGSFFIEKAKEEMAKWFIHLPDKDLSYLPEGSQYYYDYLHAVEWSQRYALLNRQVMMWGALQALQAFVPKAVTVDESAVNCHHNYVARERHYGNNVLVTRKGAVAAHEGQLGVILGSMGARSYIVKGKGNRESFCTCSHGAGRRMSRTKARATFTVEDHIKATEGIECRKDIDVLDETPMAYKDIDAVMAAQVDLVDVVATLKQIVCVKG